ncbi:MAG: type II toxin-antitoxin system PemK/MazF family toxin [Candidatus Microsaccharimonas sp.]
MSIQKDYKIWHAVKTQINRQPPLQNYHEREIWWCSLGENVGYEEDGKNHLFERPVLVFRKFNKEIFIGLPLTTTRKNSQYYYPVEVGGLAGSIILSQLRILSSRRLQRRLERIGKKKFDAIQTKITELLIPESRNLR